MSRLQRKCLVASLCLHGLLVVLVLFGTAFFTPRRNDPPMRLMNVVPSTLIDEALSGGGGNPKLPQTEDKVKGDTLKPVPPPQAPAPEPPKPKQPEAKVEPPPPEPVKPLPVRAAEPPKTVKTVKEPKPKADEPAKPRIDIASELKPIKAADSEKERKREREEAEARERAAQQRAARERADRARRAADALASDLRREFGGATSRLQQGFRDGTKVDVGGPGGAAFANYKQFVQMAYDNAWIVTPELTDQDFVTVIKVTISRTGRVMASWIVKPSGSSLMERSVQKAMDAVRSEGLPPFPNGATDTERTFTIEFNLKARSRLG